MKLFICTLLVSVLAQAALAEDTKPIYTNQISEEDRPAYQEALLVAAKAQNFDLNCWEQRQNAAYTVNLKTILSMDTIIKAPSAAYILDQNSPLIVLRYNKDANLPQNDAYDFEFHTDQNFQTLEKIRVVTYTYTKQRVNKGSLAAPEMVSVNTLETSILAECYPTLPKAE